jgi:hypothetical protein
MVNSGSRAIDRAAHPSGFHVLSLAAEAALEGSGGKREDSLSLIVYRWMVIA